MASLSEPFRVESKLVHEEHVAILHYLAELDRGLDRLGEITGDTLDAKLYEEIHHYGRLLATAMPEHFRREEQTVLDTVSQVSPELAEFAREMKTQHDQLRARLDLFCHTLEQMQLAESPAESAPELQRLGKNFTRELGRHVALEESELSGFL
ncbi:MAG TPA: hemerythrin domain-containing protein [Candidatus Acidoferrales bacterium]